MPSPVVIAQGLELFKANWPQRFADQETHDRLLALYALGCEDLSDDEFLEAIKGGIKASRFMPTPAELNLWIRPRSHPDRDPELDYRPVGDYPRDINAPIGLYLLPQKATKTPEEFRAEHDHLRAELREKWRVMDEERRANPRPGPGMAAVNRKWQLRRHFIATYDNREFANDLLRSVAAGMAEGREHWNRIQRGLVGQP